MKRIPVFLAVAVLSQTLLANDCGSKSGTAGKPDRATLAQYLMGEAKNAPDAEQRRERITRELALQEAILADAEGLGQTSLLSAEAKIELARRRVIIETYWDEYFRAHPVTEADLKSLYQELVSVNGDRQYRLSQIIVKGDAAAHQALDALKRKKAFADVAKELSQDAATRQQGGDLGWRWKTEISPPVARALDFLKSGEFTSTPIVTPGGLLIVRLDGSRKQDFPTFEKLRPELENTLRLQTQQKELVRLQGTH